MPFNKDYYVRSTISNYEDYRKKKFSGLADDLYPYLAHRQVLDYGCATGGLIHELYLRDVSCKGTDISLWAIDFGKGRYSLPKETLFHDAFWLLQEDFNVILFLDVLEHIPDDKLSTILEMVKAPQLIVRIPVSKIEGEDFVLDVSKNDKTHIQIHSKRYWLDKFEDVGYDIFIPLNEENIYDSEGVLAGILKRI
ncbi:methyltransferase domain-containing protein [bacterium]|nr:methyltransferase domain-containing protein [bacterium]